MDLKTKQVASSDVIRLILQFLKEANLKRSLQCLQEESGVTLDAVDSLDGFQNDVIKGKWDSVLQTVATIKLPEETLQLLYEQVVCELIEAQEFGAALLICRDTPVMQALKLSLPQKYKRLDELATSARMTFDKKELYGGSSKEKRRLALAKALTESLHQVSPSRLLTLLGMALRWQQENGLLPVGAKWDLFSGTFAGPSGLVEPRVETLLRSIKIGKKSPPQSVTFSPNGKYLVTGSSDGLIEVWDWMTGELSTDLPYQQEDLLMVHDSPVLSVAFNRTSDVLVSGCQDGDIKVWDVKTGKCTRKFERAHDKGVSSLCFNAEGSQVLSGSYDNTAKCHGLHSGKTLRVFQGHASYVNSAIFTSDGSRVITASSDGAVKVWDARVADCLLTFSPPPPADGNDSLLPPVNSVFLPPRSSHFPSDAVFACTKSNTLCLLSQSGGLLKKYTSEQKCDFVTACVSSAGAWVYGLTEDHVLCTFNAVTGTLDATKKIHEKDVVGIAPHPTQAVIATISFDGNVHIFGP